MDINCKYINEVQLDEINWKNLVGTYHNGKIFLKYYNDISSGDIKKLKEGLEKIEMEIEHQDTLWPLTPFVMIFLGRLLDSSERHFEKNPNDEEIKFYKVLAEKILEIFNIVAEALDFAKGNGIEFLKENIYPKMDELLNTEEMQSILEEDFEDEEEYEEVFYEEILTEKVYCSTIYYTELVLKNFKNTIEKLEKNQEKNISEVAKKINTIF